MALARPLVQRNAHIIHGAQALQQELVHFQGSRGQAAGEPFVGLDLLHVDTTGRVGNQNPS